MANKPIGHTPLVWLDDQEFYDLMQAYRHAPIVNQEQVCASFDAVKKLITDHFEDLLAAARNIADDIANGALVGDTSELYAQLRAAIEKAEGKA